MYIIYMRYIFDLLSHSKMRHNTADILYRFDGE